MLSKLRSRLDSPWVVIARDAVLAALLVTPTVSEAHTTGIGLLPDGPVAAGVAVAAAVVVAVRSRFPRAVALLTSLTMVLDGVFFPLVFAVWSLGVRRGNTRDTWLIAAWCAVAVTVPWRPGFRLYFTDWDPQFLLLLPVFPVMFVGFPLVLGLWVWQRRQLVASLRERAVQAEEQRDMLAAKAVTDERARIARELHDVVAHRVSLLTVQAGAVSLSPNQELADFAEGIRQHGAAAMEELREMLSVLRREDGEAPKHPQPTLAAACELITEAVSAGQHVQASLPEELPEVPGSTARAVYWLLHESLINAGKHAPGSDISVSLRDHDGRLDVRVANTVGLPRAVPVPRSGFGLIGMRERVALSGGTLTAGPLLDGGFEVAATFPKEPR
ncbi:sensor histidine kinase [Kutzneria chonburiensis]|uniref:histidine kinase n=1 Tax=Kutzneria chonburiensis TaxID=1483604 RepID=A0ABV6MIB1_9PSEU|nr:histidine kinase [Kutzneria chonburiensis]